MRFTILLAPCLLACGLASAAPVPAEVKADRDRLEALWDALASPRLVDRARAVYDLLDQPQGVEFLTRKVTPVKATADDLKKWLKAINNDDEKVWKPAMAELEYHDPRTALSTAEQLELVDTDAGKKRLLLLWVPWLFHAPERVSRVMVAVAGEKVRCEYRSGDSGMSTEFYVPPFPGQDRAVWQRAALVAHVLHRADTKATRAALGHLADGHKDAPPTKTAAGLLTAKPPAPAAEFTAAHWNALMTGGPAEIVTAVVTLREAKNVPAVLKPKLPAITASKERITAWVKALDSEDKGVWQPAYAELCYFRPSLALTPGEQCDLMTTVPGRTLLVQFWMRDDGFHPPQRMELLKGFTLEATGDGLTVGWPGQGRMPLEVPIPELAKQTCYQWQRARLAVVALERMKTAEAQAVLAQLADGHPDILPTKEAKAALKRLEGK